MTITVSPITMSCFECVGFSIYACGFSVTQMRQFCLFIYPVRSKWVSSEKMISLPKSASSVTAVQAYTKPYSFGEMIKLIIWQIKHELSVTIHEISTSWKKHVGWRSLYILYEKKYFYLKFFYFFLFLYQQKFILECTKCFPNTWSSCTNNKKWKRNKF